MRRGTALVMLARAAEDLLVAQQVIDDYQTMIAGYEENERVGRESDICNLRDRAASIRLLAEGMTT